jgi:predicted phosphodiesterase
MFAIISDIHGNLEALQAVLADIERRDISKVLCLGDVIGYGPNPAECIDIVRERCSFCLLGNHDHAVFYEPCNFNLPAERACYWTRKLFEDEPDREIRNARWDFLGGLPVRMRDGNILFVHGSPRRPINEYLFPEDVFTNPQKIMSNFERLDADICFVGHTHQPGIFLEDPYFDPPHELADAPFFDLRQERAIINVGSVGQPRDRDPRASFVVIYEKGDDVGEVRTTSLVDEAMSDTLQQLEFVRIEYDIETTIKKITAQEELDDFLGHRLLEGR